MKTYSERRVIRVVDREYRNGEGYVTTADREETVEIEIDLDAIAQRMGLAAVRNKTGKSCDGLVTVRHVRKKTATN